MRFNVVWIVGIFFISELFVSQRVCFHTNSSMREVAIHIYKIILFLTVYIYLFLRRVTLSAFLFVSPCIQFRTEQQISEHSAQIFNIHGITRLCARVTRERGGEEMSIALVPDIHGNSCAVTGGRGGGRERRAIGKGAYSGFDFQPTIRYCQLFGVHYTLAHCESVERRRSITASEVEPLCQFA